MMTANARSWWQDAVIYQIYPRSFADSDDDGIGDLGGVRSRLGYIKALGIDAVWLCPVMRSPMIDHGYDVSDPRDIDPVFGDLAEMDALLEDAHEHGLRVLMDLVPNHTSSEHPWFEEALRSGPGSPARARYLFRRGKGPEGSEPPNNWASVFGGPAWTRITEPDGSPGEWYLHLFAPEQPDLDWTNPEVLDDLATTMRFWLDRGVDGFRIDVAHGMAKPEGLPDGDPTTMTPLYNGDGDARFDHDDVHDLHRRLRAVIDEYEDRVLIGEIWVRDPRRFARYVSDGELHLGFNFQLLEAKYKPDELRSAIDRSLDAVQGTPAPPTWTLSNHDVPREVTRYGSGDHERGSNRAAAALMLELALPGVVFLYNGAELGLPNVDDLPDEALQDPVWERSGHTDRGRDGARIPLPWWGTEPPYGFSGARDTWLPMPADWTGLTVKAQSSDPGSFLTRCRHAIRMRHELLRDTRHAIEWLDGPGAVLQFRRGRVLCMMNLGSQPVAAPEGRIAAASSPLADGAVPPDTTVWVIA
ncbi:glycoside hydrolase family 13 protein [Hoyosella sp. G463]|uniref:Glycoside hydrolase family 13 protein n=2 Tax=Lolliginicoccus lacisalsi TaxID=2742202 RepID=A0A927JAH7_9ACTN|nr:glycoside hydrolase family 13 protein [Lolliginicoccus lacisalsi]